MVLVKLWPCFNHLFHFSSVMATFSCHVTKSYQNLKKQNKTKTSLIFFLGHMSALDILIIDGGIHHVQITMYPILYLKNLNIMIMLNHFISRIIHRRGLKPVRAICICQVECKDFKFLYFFYRKKSNASQTYYPPPPFLNSYAFSILCL